MGGGSTTNQTSNQVSTMQLPPWVNQAAQQNYAFAQDVANRPLQQFQGQMVADVGPSTNQAWDLAAGSGGTGSDYYNAATAGLMTGMGNAAPTVTPGMLAKTDLTPYMNPYTKNVIDTSMQQLEAQRQQAVMGNADKSIQANAFGGSRQGITNAVTNAQSAMAAGQLSAQLYGQNFQQAQAGATGDLQRMLAAAQGNQQAALTQGQQNLTATGQLAALGDTANRNVLQQFGMLSQAGQQQQQQAQNVINANMQKFQQAQDYPTQQLNTLLSALGMTPYEKSQTTQGQTQTQTQQQPDFAQSALGLMQMSGILSDEGSKTDIQSVGTDPATGLKMKAFRYKGDPKSYPKVVGPMAQDVQTKFPGAVATLGKRKIIKSPLAPPLAPGRMRGALARAG
jgi:hypothetical protein